MSTRDCGSCTACCDGWLRITIDGETVEPGKRCKFSSGRHCTNYRGRPVDPCQKFVCGWLAAQSPLPDWMRPNEANVILLASYFHWRESPVDIAVPVAGGIEDRALRWLKDFAVSRRRLLIYQVDEEWYAFGPATFQTEIVERMARGETIWSMSPTSERPSGS